MKKKELTQSDIYAIYHLVDNGVNNKQIAKELNIGIKLVDDTISQRKQPQNNNIPTTSSKTTNKDMMIRQTSVKGNKSVAIMTKEASQINDDFKKGLSNQIVSRTSRNAIYRPNNKK